MKDLFVVELTKPVSGYASIPRYFVGPFASEEDAEKWVEKNLTPDPKVESYDIHVLNPIARDSRDWLCNG